MLAAILLRAIVLTAALAPVARSLARRVTPNAPRPRTLPKVKRSVTGGGGGDSSDRTRKSSKGGEAPEEEAEEGKPLFLEATAEPRLLAEG